MADSSEVSKWAGVGMAALAALGGYVGSVTSKSSEEGALKMQVQMVQTAVRDHDAACAAMPSIKPNSRPTPARQSAGNANGASLTLPRAAADCRVSASFQPSLLRHFYPSLQPPGSA